MLNHGEERERERTFRSSNLNNGLEIKKKEEILGCFSSLSLLHYINYPVSITFFMTSRCKIMATLHQKLGSFPVSFHRLPNVQ